MKRVLLVIVLAAVLYFACHRWLGGWHGKPAAGTGSGGAVQTQPEIPLAERIKTLERSIAGLRSRDNEKAKAALAGIMQNEKEFQLRARAALELGRCLLAEGKELEGLRAVSAAVRYWRGEGRDAVVKAAEPYAEKYFFTPAPTPNSTIHRVKPGDVLGKIELKYGSSVGLIKLANQMNSERIYEGQRLKVPAGPVDLMVDKTAHLLMVFCGGCYVKEYPVGIGIHDQTPEGTFTIKLGAKLIHPDWYKPGEAKPVPFGDPQNILGTRWMGFKESPTLGIHGVNSGEEDSIGKDMSAGCIRMYNPDVEELFDMAPGGSKVEIRR